MPASNNRIAGATLIRRATSAVPASAASRIRKIWNVASTVVRFPLPVQCARTGGGVNAAESGWLLLQIVAIRFRDNLPAVAQFHRHQVVGEIARRQLAARLDEGGRVVGAIDRDDKILARLAFRFGGGPLPDAVQPVRHCEDLQLPLLQPA